MLDDRTRPRPNWVYDERMPVTWDFRGPVLTLSISGAVTNREIEHAIDAALANAPSRSGMRLLWDARATEGPLSSDDVAWRIEAVASLGERGVLCRAGLLGRIDQRASLAIWGKEGPRALRALAFRLFTDEAEARAWLEE
jgi:hypothetical protein